MTDKKAAWAALSAAAKAHALAPMDAVASQHLSEMAKAWASASRPPRETGGEVVRIPPKFGRSAGMAVVDLETKDLQWYAGAIGRSLDDPEKANFRERNKTLLDAIEAELETR